MRKLKLENFDEKAALEAPPVEAPDSGKVGSAPPKKHVTRRKSDLPQVLYLNPKSASFL